MGRPHVPQFVASQSSGTSDGTESDNGTARYLRDVRTYILTHTHTHTHTHIYIYMRDV